MRGENEAEQAAKSVEQGSPPHARGKYGHTKEDMLANRITPACAGKMSIGQDAQVLYWDHPRMRGENYSRYCYGWDLEGSPPHARGKSHALLASLFAAGITPACAGKISPEEVLLIALGDHPRMRGENSIDAQDTMPMEGSPPHARGKFALIQGRTLAGGITPACAGKIVRSAGYR